MTEDWLLIETAPKDQTKIKGKLPNGKEVTMIWAWGGGWAGEWDPRRPNGLGGWFLLNDEHQPIAWRHDDSLVQDVDKDTDD